MKTGLIVGIVVLIIVAGAGMYFVMTQQGPTEITTTSAPQTQTTTTQTTSAPPTSSTIQTTTTLTTTTPPQTTTTPPQTTTTTTTPPTTTTTATGTTIQVSQLTLNGLFGNFTHAKIVATIINSSTGETNVYTLEYTETPDTLNGQQVIRIDFTYAEEGGDQQSFTMWVTPDFQHVMQIEMEGQTITGPNAELIGQQILNGISTMFFVTYAPNFEFYVTEETAEMTAHGWSLDAFQPIQVDISGVTYSGYYFKATNVNDAESNTQSVEGKIVELHANYYYLVYIKIVDKDGNTYQFELTELAPAT